MDATMCGVAQTTSNDVFSKFKLLSVLITNHNFTKGSFSKAHLSRSALELSRSSDLLRLTVFNSLVKTKFNCPIDLFLCFLHPKYIAHCHAFYNHQNLDDISQLMGKKALIDLDDTIAISILNMDKNIKDREWMEIWAKAQR